MTMRHRALLACRSPPRLSRCPTTLPEEAWIGLAASSADQVRSLRSRSGLSPAAQEQPGGGVRAFAVGGDQRGSEGSGDPAPPLVEVGERGVELGDAPGEGTQAELGDCAQVVTLGRAERGADRQQLAPAQSPQLVGSSSGAVVIRSRICSSAWVRAL
jgi:hypothetical protein